MSAYEIKQMNREQVNIAIDWAAREGWNPGLHDADAFLAIDSNGFFVGELDGIPIAVGSALAYDDTFGFCGFYIVDPAYRGSGYGLQLTKARLEYLGDLNVGLDGVIDMSDKYARLGYRTAHINTRYSFVPKEIFPVPDQIQSAPNVNFDQLVEYDRAHFPVKRASFLERWISQSDGTALVSAQDGQIMGFGVIRKCREGYKIGPLFAETPTVAHNLFNALCNRALNEPVYLDLPEPNADAVELVRRNGMQKIFSCARMYLREDPGLPLDKIYGITTFEAG